VRHWRFDRDFVGRQRTSGPVRPWRMFQKGVPVARIPAIIHEAFRDRLLDILEPPESAQIATIESSQVANHRVVKFITPLSIQPIPTNGGWANYANIIEVAFSDDPSLAAEALGLLVKTRA
jgi:hypothetical protein